MSQTATVKKALEAAATQKAVGATTGEARTTANLWKAIADNVEATNDLRGLAVHWRDELQGAINRSDSAAVESALQALGALAGRFDS